MNFASTFRKPASRPAGFTMIELLAVIAILAVLVALVVSVGKYIQEKAAKDQTIATMNVIKSALEAYFDAEGEYPPSDVRTIVGTCVENAINNNPACKNGGCGRHFTIGDSDGYRPGDSISILHMYLTGMHYWEKKNDDKTDHSLDANLTGKPAVQAALQRIQYLPVDAMGVTERVFRDGYGTPLRYYRTRGIGGKPLLVSAGPDTRFGDATNVDAGKDDIRSDGR